MSEELQRSDPCQMLAGHRPDANLSVRSSEGATLSWLQARCQLINEELRRSDPQLATGQMPLISEEPQRGDPPCVKGG